MGGIPRHGASTFVPLVTFVAFAYLVSRSPGTASLPARANVPLLALLRSWLARTLLALRDEFWVNGRSFVFRHFLQLIQHGLVHARRSARTAFWQYKSAFDGDAPVVAELRDQLLKSVPIAFPYQ